MKIISKHYDFYDAVGQYDSDNSIVWKRNPTWHTIDDKMLYLPLNIRNNETKLAWATIGIYPYIYKVPVAMEITKFRTPKLIFLTYEELWDKDKSDEIVYKKLNLKGPKTYEIHRGKKELYENRCFIDKIKINQEEFKRIENQDIFRKYNTPVFTRSNSVIFEGKDYELKYGYSGCSEFVTDAVFTYFKYDVLRGIRHMLDPYETYANIENFWWSMKSEPIPNPSNDTKILSAGFDLKTSFRNIK